MNFNSRLAKESTTKIQNNLKLSLDYCFTELKNKENSKKIQTIQEKITPLKRANGFLYSINNFLGEMLSGSSKTIINN